MYTCSLCSKEILDGKKCCPNSTIYCSMNAQMQGVGGVSEAPKPNNNLSEESAMVVKQMMTMVLGTEFFRDGKLEVFANDIIIEDSSSHRKFSFTLTAKEV